MNRDRAVVGVTRENRESDGCEWNHLCFLVALLSGKLSHSSRRRAIPKDEECSMTALSDTSKKKSETGGDKAYQCRSRLAY
eukprot:scaffold3361_cov166-Amphora_coffeaeformis.AAC.1